LLVRMGGNGVRCMSSLMRGLWHRGWRIVRIMRGLGRLISVAATLT
jgi:hypothetical protein